MSLSETAHTLERWPLSPLGKPELYWTLGVRFRALVPVAASEAARQRRGERRRRRRKRDWRRRGLLKCVTVGTSKR